MKYHNGCWLLKEGFAAFSPKHVYEVRKGESELVLCAPTARIEKKGDTLGGINLTVRVTAPMPEVIRVQAYHHKGGLKKEPEFALNLPEPGKLHVEEEAGSIRVRSGRLGLVIDTENWSMAYERDGKLYQIGSELRIMTFTGAAEVVGEEMTWTGEELWAALEAMPEGRTLYVEPGIYYIGECVWHLPSHTHIYLEPGAILIGGLALEHGEGLRIDGRGILYLADFARFSSINGIRLNHSRDILLEGLIFINPPHYTVSLGDCEDVTIRNIKSFSCEGWSDGVDMMSSRRVLVEDCFLRTSDDCVAIYGSRWDNYGGSREITVRRTALWADVAHPMMIGTHGDHAHEGDVIEEILFEDIDVLEHHEFQPGYLGVMAINAGDKNLVRNVTYRRIRIEPFEHGKVLDFQVKWNRDYNPAPGRGIRDILVEKVNIMSGDGEEPSVIAGYSQEFSVRGIEIRDFYRDGRKAESLEEAGIIVGECAEDIRIQ